MYIDDKRDIAWYGVFVWVSHVNKFIFVFHLAGHKRFGDRSQGGTIDIFYGKIERIACRWVESRIDSIDHLIWFWLRTKSLIC